MKVKKLIRQIKAPCSKCPYKLGLVHMTVNPCPQCKGNSYQTYEHFQQQAHTTSVEGGRR